jgi:hypothetical protein
MAAGARCGIDLNLKQSGVAIPEILLHQNNFFRNVNDQSGFSSKIAYREPRYITGLLASVADVPLSHDLMRPRDLLIKWLDNTLKPSFSSPGVNSVCRNNVVHIDPRPAHLP